MRMRSKILGYPGMAGWYFLSLPKEEAAKIKEKYHAKKRGWGSLPVKITIGKTTWTTSIFPDKKSETYVLPLKAEVRKKEEIGMGDIVEFTLVIK